jgi:hypothetical protein
MTNLNETIAVEISSVIIYNVLRDYIQKYVKFCYLPNNIIIIVFEYGLLLPPYGKEVKFTWSSSRQLLFEKLRRIE